MRHVEHEQGDRSAAKAGRVTERMSLTAMEGMESCWRYEDRLLAQRKIALAVLLRLQGK